MSKLGSYCGLSVNGVELFCTKNTFNRMYLNLFSPMNYTEYVEIIDGEQHEQYTLRTSAKDAKRRLEILVCNEKRLREYFDNDAAAEAELSSIKDIPILESIRIMRLPELEFCNSYPTIGPTGCYNSNINGQAVSIELFFGTDIIATDGKLYTNKMDKL